MCVLKKSKGIRRSCHCTRKQEQTEKVEKGKKSASGIERKRMAYEKEMDYRAYEKGEREFEMVKEKTREQT